MCKNPCRLLTWPSELCYFQYLFIPLGACPMMDPILLHRSSVYFDRFSKQDHQKYTLDRLRIRA